MITAFEFDFAFIEVDTETGFATIRDTADGLEIYELDSLQEAIEFLENSL